MSDVTMPKARVWPKPDGTLRFNQWEGARRPDDEGWWDDVLRDPRAKAPTDTYINNEHHARWRLEHVSAQLNREDSAWARIERVYWH